MGLYSHNGLIVMLLFHLCQAQDAVPPSPDPEPASPSLGDVINAVKAAFEQAIQTSTDGDIHEALERAAEEHVPRKTPAEQPPAAENVADHTTEEAAVVRISEEETAVLTAGEPDAHVSESNEPTDEESVQGRAQEAKLTHTDEEPSRLIEQESFQERSESEPTKAVGSDTEVAESVVVQVSEANTENVAEDLETEESPVHSFTVDTQTENETGREAGEVVERSAGVPRKVWKPSGVEEVSEMEKTLETERVEVTIDSEVVKTEGLQEDEHVKILPGVVRRPEAEFSQEQRHVGIAVEDVGGAVVEIEGQLEKEHGATGDEGAVTAVEAEKLKAKTELQTFLGEEEVPPTRKPPALETQQEAEVILNTKGSLKWQEPDITKVQATGGTAYEVNDVNEIITSRDSTDKIYGEPALVNKVEDLPPTPTLGLELRETEARAEEPDDSTYSKASGQEAWKIGAIAAAFFLILQTAVTIVYILKCRRKPNSIQKKLCARGNGGLEYDATNTDATISMDEQIAVDDLPEYSQVQQEDVAMTTIPPDSSEKTPSHDLRTSVV